MRPPRSRKPPKASVYAVMTHCWSASLIPSASLAVGSARFTIEASSTTMSALMAMTSRARQRLGSGGP